MQVGPLHGLSGHDPLPGSQHVFRRGGLYVRGQRLLRQRCGVPERPAVRSSRKPDHVPVDHADLPGRDRLLPLPGWREPLHHGPELPSHVRRQHLLQGIDRQRHRVQHRFQLHHRHLLVGPLLRERQLQHRQRLLRCQQLLIEQVQVGPGSQLRYDHLLQGIDRDHLHRR